jgi:hypothetical protein
VVVLPDAAHVPHMQTPDVIAELWRRFQATVQPELQHGFGRF